MNIDAKNPLLKNFVSSNSNGLGKQGMKSSIDQSSVASAEQRSLDLELRNQNEKGNSKKDKKESKSEEAKAQQVQIKDETKLLAEKDKIVRDPMKLLKAF